MSDEKTIAVIALTIIACASMWIFKDNSLPIISGIVAGILGMTNTGQQK